MKYKYYYFYKITNNINNHFYYGVHCTNNLEDGYMGSGKALRRAYDKYGISNFQKEIIKFFDTMDEAFEYDAQIVNDDLVRDKNCYNLMLGGKTFSAISGFVTVKYKNTDDQYFVVTIEEYYNNKDMYAASWQDKHHTQETKNKVRQKMTPKESTNNRVWINKNGEVKYLLKIKLNEYLNNGWELGRVGYKPKSRELKKEENIKQNQIKEQKRIEREKAKEQNKKLKELKQIEQNKKKEFYKKAIMSLYQESNIDFSKMGWVKIAKQYLKNNFGLNIIEPLYRMIKRYYPSFYNDKNIFIKKPNIQNKESIL